MKAQRQTGSHAADELGVVLALPSADAVIDVGYLQTETEGRSGFVQKVQQRHGVRAAGHAHEHRVAGRQHAVPDKGLGQLFLEIHGGGKGYSLMAGATIVIALAELQKHQDTPHLSRSQTKKSKQSRTQPTGATAWLHR